MAYSGGSTWSWSCSQIAVQGHYLSYCNFRITTSREKLTSRKNRWGRTYSGAARNIWHHRSRSETPNKPIWRRTKCCKHSALRLAFSSWLVDARFSRRVLKIDNFQMKCNSKSCKIIKQLSHFNSLILMIENQGKNTHKFNLHTTHFV
jgi:hypothetical protein